MHKESKSRSYNGKQSFAHAAYRLLIGLLPKNTWLRRLLISLIIIITLALSSMYGIAQWYIHRHSGEPLTIGATFIPDYAKSLGVDPKETLDAMISDLGVKRLRLVS
ncbi:MAG TPA: hypothetical protein VFS31_18325, partial [Chitinophagaceae bacterium]|nr:hypothetical protein [Chitinophagaceae bacterium]